MYSHREHDDLVLWNEFTTGQVSSYEEIYNRYVDELYRYSHLVLADKSHAEDVIHDVFADLWSNRHKLGHVRSVRLYLFTCIKRSALKKQKKERRFTFFNESGKEGFALDVVPSFLDETINVQERSTLVKKLKQYVGALSKRQREIIYLRFYQNLAYAEIAELLELDQKYVYNLASKAFCTLRKIVPNNLITSLFLLLSLIYA